MNKTHLKDELTKKIGVLMRRETEVRILIPFLQGLYEEFGKDINRIDILESPGTKPYKVESAKIMKTNLVLNNEN